MFQQHWSLLGFAPECVSLSYHHHLAHLYNLFARCVNTHKLSNNEHKEMLYERVTISYLNLIIFQTLITDGTITDEIPSPIHHLVQNQYSGDTTGVSDRIPSLSPVLTESLNRQ